MSGDYSAILTMCIVVFVLTISAVALLLTMEYIKKNRYERLNEKQERKSEMNKIRDYYEHEIYMLQEKITNTEKRWADANHLIINGQKVSSNQKMDFILDIPFFAGIGISNENLKIDKKSVFVLTPFLEKESPTYFAIRDVCSEVNLNCRRGDESYRDKDILSHIISEMLKARVVIVNLTGRNPNVFYELGICHAIGKPVILVSEVEFKASIPFDVQSKNIVLYKDKEDLKNQLKNELLKLLVDELV